MNKNISSLLFNNINCKFLANISFAYGYNYKVISNFFGFAFTKNSYRFFLNNNKLKGFNNSFNVFLCPWESRSLKSHIESLKSKEEKEEFEIDAFIVSGRLINIYSDKNKTYLYNILKDSKLPFFNFDSYISFFLFSFLNYHLNILFFQLIIIRNLKR